MIGAGPFFEPAEGLKTVRALLAAIRDDKQYSSKLQEAEYTLEELKELERCLSLAEQAGAKFRLEIG